MNYQPYYITKPVYQIPQTTSYSYTNQTNPFEANNKNQLRYNTYDTHTAPYNSLLPNYHNATAPPTWLPNVYDPYTALPSNDSNNNLHYAGKPPTKSLPFNTVSNQPYENQGSNATASTKLSEPGLIMINQSQDEDSINKNSRQPFLPHMLNTVHSSNNNVVQPDLISNRIYLENTTNSATNSGLEKALTTLKHLDRNGITEYDFIDTIRKLLPCKYGDKFAKKLFKQMDRNKDGRIEVNKAFDSVKTVYHQTANKLRKFDSIATRT